MVGGVVGFGFWLSGRFLKNNCFSQLGVDEALSRPRGEAVRRPRDEFEDENENEDEDDDDLPLKILRCEKETCKAFNREFIYPSQKRKHDK